MISKKTFTLMFGVLFLFSLISFTSAVIVKVDDVHVDSLILNEEYNSEQLVFVRTITEIDDNLTYFDLSLTPELEDVVQLNNDNVSYFPQTLDTIIISIKSDAEPGNYSGYLFYNTNQYFQIKANIPEDGQVTVTSDLIVFPTSKVVNVKKGNEKTYNILVSVPSNYPRTVTIQSLDFNPSTEPISLGDLSLGQIAPGSSINIPVVFSGVDAQTGTYQATLSILATDSQGQIELPDVSLTLYISETVTPVTGDTFSTPPTCALSATSLNLNNTYTFTCSGITSNLEIAPEVSEFFEGKSVEVTDGLYRYDFTPVKYGETTFKAVFRYNGAPVFSPFEQDVRITSAGSVIAGTNLKFLFTPRLDQATSDNESYIIQLVDNKTNSLVDSPRIWVDAVEITSATDTFIYNFDLDKDYELRGRSPGYNDLVETININPLELNVSITPSTGGSSTNFNITTEFDDVKIQFGDKSFLGSYYGTLPAGIVELRFSKDGYKTKTINFTVDDRVRVTTYIEEFKKGQTYNLTLSDDCNWSIYYRENAEDQLEMLSSGEGRIIELEVKKSGQYFIRDGDTVITTYTTVSSGKFLGVPIIAWVIVGILIVIVAVIVISRKSSKDYGGSDDAGLSMAVGRGY